MTHQADGYDIYRSATDETLRLMVKSGRLLPHTFGNPWIFVEQRPETEIHPIDREHVRECGFTIFRAEWETHAA